ncbi:MlaD family protein [Phycisphaerales bacterium AB-hyl4]|uniref:MlaD family protein n=1 Tax=Natronomicrosphaera hydrolytica TaxID=3242702 RepID=A0ABV4U0D8_9BACT
MDDRKRNLAVGLTAAIGLVGVLVMMLLFGDVANMFNRTYPVTIELPEAGGVNPGSRVQLHGIEIGQVETVRFRHPPGTGVEVMVKVRDNIQIPTNAQVNIETPLLAGSPMIAMRSPRDEPPEDYLPRDGSARIRGEVPTIATALAQELQAVFDERLDQFDGVLEHFETLSTEWQRVGQHVNMLLEPRNADDVDAEQQEANVTTVISRLDRRLAELEEMVSGINRYVNDDEMYDNLRQTLTSSRVIAERAEQTVEKLGESIEENVVLLRRRYVALADDLAGAVGSMHRLVDDAREGEGTVGRLIKDPELYENLNDAAERIQTTSDELRLLIEKWRAEGLPVQF